METTLQILENNFLFKTNILEEITLYDISLLQINTLQLHGH